MKTNRFLSEAIFGFALAILGLALTASAQQISVAVLPSDGTVLSNDELEVLTDKMRESALKVLPLNTFVLLKQDVVIKRLGGAENYIKECSESTCIVNLGKKAQVDYVAQASVGKLGNKIRLKVELYSVRTEGLIGMLNGEAENVYGLLALIDEKASDLFKSMLVESKAPKNEPSIEVEKPELAKLEPEPMKPVPKKPKVEEPNVEKPFKTSFWVGLGLDVVGAAIIYVGYVQEKDAQYAYDNYKIRGQSRSYYGDAWEHVEYYRSERNGLYAIGGILLASGIGVHIWF